MSAISPTQVSLWELCPVKFAAQWWGKDWGFSDEREPAGDSLVLGREMHGFAEAYLRDGKQPDRFTLAGEMFINGLKYLPPPHPDNILHTEHAFDLRVGGNLYSGSMDWYGPIPGTGERVLLDHKTSKNPESYGLWQPWTTNKGDGYKERKGWYEDPQVLIYAAYDLVKHPEAKSAQMRWVYYNVPSKRRKTVYSVASDFVVERDIVTKQFGQRVHPTACAINAAKEARPDPNSLAHNLESCEAFNRPCWYADKGCKPPQTARHEQLFGLRPKPKAQESSMDLMELIKSGGVGAKPSQAPAAPAHNGATQTAADVVNPPEARTSARPAAASNPFEAFGAPAPVAAAPVAAAPAPSIAPAPAPVAEIKIDTRGLTQVKTVEVQKDSPEVVPVMSPSTFDRNVAYNMVELLFSLGMESKAVEALRNVLKSAL